MWLGVFWTWIGMQEIRNGISMINVTPHVRASLKLVSMHRNAVNRQSQSTPTDCKSCVLDLQCPYKVPLCATESTLPSGSLPEKNLVSAKEMTLEKGENDIRHPQRNHNQCTAFSAVSYLFLFLVVIVSVSHVHVAPTVTAADANLRPSRCFSPLIDTSAAFPKQRTSSFFVSSKSLDLRSVAASGLSKNAAMAAESSEPQA